MKSQERTYQIGFYGYMLSVNFLFLAAALVFNQDGQMLSGLAKTLTSFAGSTMDYFSAGGLSAALLNVSLSGFLAFLVFLSGKTKASGSGLMAYMITLGFSFYGKTFLTSLPIVVGVYLYSRLNKIKWTQNTAMALFACSLDPTVSLFAFHPLHLKYPLFLRSIVALSVGLLIGLIVPIVSKHSSKIHKGFNIYNVGLSGGLTAWFIFQIYRSTFLAQQNLDSQGFLQSVFSSGEKTPILILYSLLFLLLFLWGLYIKTYGEDKPSLSSLFKRSGHNCDFVKEEGLAATFWNMAIIGIIFLTFYYLVGAPFTGPTVGALLCAICLSSNGVSLTNAWPSFAGYFLASLVMPFSLGSQAQAVTLSFALALAPISGVYGWFWGIIGGFAHAAIAPYSAAVHGGLTLYNGGFAAGIIAAVLVPIMEHFKEQRAN
ncbi:MAG: DUF1576 domain-containing protein [Firmicutes bacterium]|nr:DUF1576 domain-containing protein [Bacillota bacterium]